MTEQAPDQITVEEAAVLEVHLRDPIWRVCNLYKIVDKQGHVIPFRPTPPQLQILEAIYLKKQRRHVILKARRMGFSTLIEIIIFDATYWGENLQASIVDLTQADASEKLNKKVKFAYEALPPAMREPLKQDSAKIMEFQNKSSINAGKNARGGTNQWLHVSEWGPIAHEDPRRSEEIKTGALPSADEGHILVESTFKGGKGGHFYELIKKAQETPLELKTDKDFHFHFFPWYEDATHTLEGDPASISESCHEYLNGIEARIGRTFTAGQRLWYFKTALEQGIFMFREYPSLVEEAFKAPVDGSIYGDIISQLRSKGRIRTFEYDRSSPVFSTWDIGWADSTSIWLLQLVGFEVRVIWHTKQEHRTAAEMAHLMDATGIPVSAHYVPHDATSKSPGEGKNYKDAMTAAGLVNIIGVPRVTNIWDGINALRNLLHRCWFNVPACEAGLSALEAYHTKDTASGGTVVKEPVHDWSSHDSSALRIFAEALELGMVRPVNAKKIIENPRYPDGSLVSIESVREVRRRSRQGRALSGHTPFA